MRLKEYMNEASYSAWDVPKVFKVVIKFERNADKVAKELSDGVLNGVKGISSNGEIIWEYLGVARDALLIMPGEETVKLNKLSRYLYTNPNYFFSKNMHHLKRLFMKERRQEGALRNIMEYLFAIFVKNNLFSKFDVRYMAPYQMMEMYPTAKNVKINSVKDFIKWFRDTYRKIASEDVQFKDYYFEVLESISDADMKKYIQQVFEQYIYPIYGSEQEWEVKDEKLKMPKKSILYILKTDIKGKDKMWKFINRYETERTENVEKAIKKYNLDSKMKVKFIDPRKWKDLQAKHLRRKYK